MRVPRAVIATLLAAAPLALPAGETQRRLTWISADGESRWTVPLGAEREPGRTPAPLLGPAWLDPVPDLEIGLVGGGTFRLSSARGRVVLLDFWASWCAPCLQELPALEKLSAANAKTGRLAIVTINARETDAVAGATARRLGLTLPIGRYDRALDEAFRVRGLPTIVLIDASGRLRARWDGYGAGIEGEVASRVAALVAGGSEPAPRRLGEVVAGPARLDVAWAREMDAPVEGLAAVGGSDASILASSGREIVLLAADGRTIGRMRTPTAAGRLVLADLHGDGHVDAVSFRPGAREVLVADTRVGAVEALESPEPVLALAAVGAAPPSRRSGRLALATTRGVLIAEGSSGAFRRVEGTGETRDVAAAANGGFIALESRGVLRWIGPEGLASAPVPAPRGDSRIVATATAGMGVATSEAATTALCRLAGPAGPPHVAVATADGELVVANLASGAALWRARWSGVRHLAAADVDGDGRDELIVGAGRWIGLLEMAP